MAPQVEYILDHGQAPAAAPAPAPVTATGSADESIQLVREELVVGKRDVDLGTVRIAKHMVETPVEEQVRLRDERVMVERRPINRPLTGPAADAFRERTLSVAARGEQAVVGKTARVVEEIGIRKDAVKRVETVRDTVRETKVDVEQVGSAAREAGRSPG